VYVTVVFIKLTINKKVLCSLIIIFGVQWISGEGH